MLSRSTFDRSGLSPVRAVMGDSILPFVSIG